MPKKIASVSEKRIHMKLSTTDLVLASDAAIDLQLHTTYSDGVWAPEQLIDYLVREQFSLAAITDHDRVDTLAALQQLAMKKQLPLLVAAEMSASWQGGSQISSALGLIQVRMPSMN